MENTLEKREETVRASSIEEKEKYLDEKEGLASVNESDRDTRDTRDAKDIDYENEDVDIEIVNQIASIVDDPEIKVLTIRSVVAGSLLACLGASVYQLMFFKPVPVPLSNVFMLIIGYLMCIGSTRLFKEGTLLNPCPFNIKEHTLMFIIISTANASAYGTYILGAQQLYYKDYPSAAGGIFLLFATQLIGYGIAGQLRPFLVYPSIMIWPRSIPTISFLRTFNTPGDESRVLMKFFFSIFFGIFVWEIFPQYMFPILGGISIVCLAKRDSVWVQNLFGGLGVNEGLGIGSISLDWTNLSMLSPLVLPLYVQSNIYAGIFITWLMAPLIYYYNLWDAKSFPFLSNGLFRMDPETGEAVDYPQDLILDEHNNINQTALEEIGRPYFNPLYAIGYIISNLAVTAMITHVALFYGSDIKRIAMAILRRKESRENDVHNRLMAAYKEVPAWWYYTIFVCGIGLNIGIGYANHSQLPWWGFLLAILLATVLSLPLNMITAITGNGFGLNVVAEMICGFILPGNPIANMYFKTLGFNTLSQAGIMANDLKIGHYMKIPPKITFLGQMIGTVIGCIFNYIVNYSIINSKREQLLDPNGNIWSGAEIQTMNAAGITWGGIGPMFMFGPDTQYSFFLWSFIAGFGLPIPFWILHRFYPKAGFDLVNTPMILYGLNLFPGYSYSWITVSFIIILVSQLYIKKRYNKWYIKHNYLMSAALDSGASLMSFILAMSVFGGGDGVERPFPTWAGNPDLVYLDYCCADCQ
ncbi:OPT family small oligopeptide transporter [Phycomyces nitens]|nr:OPT family small oligopeptide transporter [Phycomyces nitens]